MDPSKALLDEISVTYAHVQWLREKVADLDEVEHLTKGTREHEWAEADDEPGNPDAHALVWGQTEYRNKVGPDYRRAGRRECLVRTRSASRSASTWSGSTAALKAGIEECRVRLGESQGELVARVTRGALEALNLTTDQWVLVQTVVPRELRALSAE
ncbi:TOBE domain-containing protein [Arthrobacter sp. zg-Y1219]|uniref:TOBE domain-containing protein n=1 Tax=Arthrobacter sp. zg-Y1219 TaxID=3049067 RepID=UPI0024C29BAB|nr:TOBE domain-containing protein [Arthrobacter sp. zg-Y1219]MDK1360296.1 TOBE domain-containing protein [Arthrobacter sp. zg-Y1219]